MNKPSFGLGSGEINTSNNNAQLIKDTTTKDFVADVIDASKNAPVLVDFWSTRCEPCKQLTPILEKAVTDAQGKVFLVKMNVDEHPAIFSQIASQLGVRSIPAVIAFKDGQPVDGFVGALPESQIKTFLNGLIDEGDDIDAVLETADEAFEEGDFETALEVYQAVLGEDGENLKAIAGVAKCYLKENNIEKAKETLDLAPLNKKDNSIIANVRANLELLEKSDDTVDLNSLEQKVSENPEDFQSRFDLAVALNSQDKKGEAMEALFDIIKRKPNWNEGAAKTQLIQFFDAWGADDPHTLEGRKQLSLLLFS